MGLLDTTEYDHGGNPVQEGGTDATPLMKQIAPRLYGMPTWDEAMSNYQQAQAQRYAQGGLLGMIDGWKDNPAAPLVIGAITPTGKFAATEGQLGAPITKQTTSQAIQGNTMGGRAADWNIAQREVLGTPQYGNGAVMDWGMKDPYAFQHANQYAEKTLQWLKEVPKMTRESFSWIKGE